MLNVSVDRHETSLIGPGDLPGRTLRKPVFRLLPLIAVVYFLFEQTIFIVNPVTAGGHPQSSQRIHETSGQASEASITQRRILFAVLHRFQICAEFAQSLPV